MKHGDTKKPRAHTGERSAVVCQGELYRSEAKTKQASEEYFLRNANEAFGGETEEVLGEQEVFAYLLNQSDSGQNEDAFEAPGKGGQFGK